MDLLKKEWLTLKATRVRKHIIDAVYRAASGHPGGSLSAADILTVLYFEVMCIDPERPKWEERDRFVLSKGHCTPALYGVLAERGFFPASEISKFRSINSYLQGHPDMKGIPGIDMSTGSLGQGISAACGMALSGKINKNNFRVYTILGDGELEEGQVWEAAMFSAHYKLDNLTAFIDNNGLQIDGKISDVMSPLPIDEKFRSFGWYVVEIDGHNYEQISDAVNIAHETKGRPTAIIAKTIKGMGITYMENQASWHGNAPNREQYELAVLELNKVLETLEVKA